MISEQKMDSEKSGMEYYRYLNHIYEEVSEFPRSEDGAVNPQKLEMMFEKTASPYVYWHEAKDRERRQGEDKTTSAAAPGSSGDVNKQGKGSKLSAEEAAKLLGALKMKYGLQESGEDYRLTKGVPQESFETLSKAMKNAGYVYSRDSRSFRKGGVR